MVEFIKTFVIDSLTNDKQRHHGNLDHEHKYKLHGDNNGEKLLWRIKRNEKQMPKVYPIM